MANPPAQQGTLAWARPLTRVAAGALVLLGVAGVVAGFVLPWSRFDPAGGHWPPVGLRAACAVLGPGLSLLAAAVSAARRQPAAPVGPAGQPAAPVGPAGQPAAPVGPAGQPAAPVGPAGQPAAPVGRVAVRLAPAARRVAALGALAVAAFAVLQLVTIRPVQGYGAGGPLTVLGALALAAGWLAGGPPLRPADRAGIARVPGWIVLAGTALLVGNAAWAGQLWFTQERFVDADPAAAVAPSPLRGPESLAQRRWQRTVSADQLVGLVGGALVIRDSHGVRGLDPASGRERWHYLRSDLRPVNAAGTADGRSVLLFYAQGRGVLAVSLDAGTGRQHWARQLNAPAADPWSAGTLAALPDGVAAVELDAGHPARLVDAGSPGAGRRAPRLPDGCTVTGLAGAGDVLAVGLRCAGSDAVVGVAARDGAQRWRWQPPYPAGYTATEPLALTGAGTGVLVEYGERPQATGDGPVVADVPRSGSLLDPATGTAGPEFRVPGTLLVAGASTAVYLDGAAVGVDLASGKVHWSTSLRPMAGFHPVAGRVTGGTAYLAWRAAPDDGRVNGDGGPLGVVALNLGTGQLTASTVLPADLSSCRPGSDGRTLCGQRPVTLAVGSGVLVLAEQRDTQLALTAVG